MWSIIMLNLIGILGCTALAVTAFGAKNAVRTILDKQFSGIFHYNVSVGFNDDEASAELTSRLLDETYFDEYSEELRKSAEASINEDSKKSLSFNQCMKPRIRNIDMLESLKSVD